MEKLTSTNPADNYTPLGEVPISSNEEILEKVSLETKQKLHGKNLE